MRYSKKSAITWGLTALLCLQLAAVSAAAQPVENSGAPAAAKPLAAASSKAEQEVQAYYEHVVEYPKLDAAWVAWARQHNAAVGAGEYAGFLWRADSENAARLPRNFRTCQSPYTKAVKGKFTAFMNKDTAPTRQGLDTLRISGSAEMSYKEFQAAVEQLRKLTTGPIYDVDLRQESHGYFDGQAVSWYGLRDWGNADKKDDRKAILRDEQQRLQAAGENSAGLVVARITEQAEAPKIVRKPVVQTEEEVAKSLGIRYFRITARDHLWPAPQYIDQFLRFYRGLPKDAWLHFHCEAGAGRTTAYMVMVDILNNPELPLADILQRQYMIGGNYVAYTIKNPKAGSWKAPFYAEKARMLPVFYAYVQENKATGFAVPWSKWLASHPAAGTASI